MASVFFHTNSCFFNSLFKIRFLPLQRGKKFLKCNKGQSMEKKFGFSLAEALITLLIIALITVLSAPVITKKARKREDTNMWTFVKNKNKYIYPTNNNDIMLGSTKQPKGIVVNGVLVFKNTKGETIGWIAEDGTNSFTLENQGMALPSISDEDMKKLVEQVQKSIDVNKLTQQVQNAGKIAEKTAPKPVSGNNEHAQNNSVQSTDLNIDINALMNTINQINNQQR